MDAPFPAIAGEALARLMEAREAWLAYIFATTTEEHFAAVDRMNTALAVTQEEAGLS